MKIASWNVNGIRSAYNKGFIEWFRKEKADFVCLQEIKSDKVPEAFSKLKGYRVYWNPAEKKGYSGTAILAKKEPIKVSKLFGNEGRVLQLDYPDFAIINVYFPHGGRDKSKLLDKLEMYNVFTEYLLSIRKSVILCGDFNVAHEEKDLSRPGQNKKNIMFTPEERMQISNIVKNGYADTFRHFNKESGNYTWWPYGYNARKRNLGWRIDYIFVSNKLVSNLVRAYIQPEVEGSDHCPIGIEIKI